MGSLCGKVALVTGASRGIGKGVAIALAREGMTVYITGRTVNEGDYYLPGTVGGTAADCDAAGGRGIAVACDHGDDEAVAALFERIATESGRLDLLVNNAFSLSDDLLEPKGFWDKPLANLEMWDVGVKSNYVAAWHAARIMVPQGSGLIVAISGFAATTYTYGVIFGTSKTAVGRMTRDMAVELKPHECCRRDAVAGADADRKGQGQPREDGRQDDHFDHLDDRQFGRASRAGNRRAGSAILTS